MPLNWSLNACTEEELERVGQELYGESQDKVDQALADLKAWIKKSPHLQLIRQDREFLLFFLRGCGHSVEKTKKGLDFYFSVKATLPAWFAGWDPEQEGVRKALAAAIFLPLPGFDRKGRWVFLIRFGAVDPSSMRVDTLYKTAIMLLDRAIEGNIQVGVRGIVVVADLGGLTASHIPMMTPATLKKHIVVFQDAYPMKDNKALIQSSAMHFINMPKIVQTVFNLFLSMSKEEFRKMNHVHPVGDTRAIIEDLGAEVLPIEYGGSGSSVKEVAFYWQQEVRDQRNWFARMEGHKAEEDKRSGGKKTHSELFGIEGSFRKLDID